LIACHRTARNVEHDRKGCRRFLGSKKQKLSFALCSVGQISDLSVGLATRQETCMSEQASELIELSKLNGNFKRNYGKLIGTYLYLRSISAARGRPYIWSGLLVAALTAGLAWLERTEF
jgi:hypothetical protein